jgi:hypothetical protein
MTKTPLSKQRNEALRLTRKKNSVVSRIPIKNRNLPATACIQTAGNNFPNAMIDLVRDPADSNILKLLFWDGAAAKVASQIEYEGSIYEPITLGSTLADAVQWPTCPISSGSTKDLFGKVLSLIMHNVDMQETSARLLTYFVFSTWFPDRLSLAPGLAILGPADSEGVQLLKLLRCLCRRSMLLAEASQSSLLALPLELSPTLLINRPRITRQFRTFLTTSNRRGLSTVRKGRIVELCCPKAVYFGMDPIPQDVASTVLQVSLSVSMPKRLLENEALTKIAAEFQGKMLGYRLANFARIRVSSVHAPAFTHQTRELAMNLAACIVDDDGLSQAIIPLLKKQDDNAREQPNRMLDEAILEAVLTCLHEKKHDRVQVKDIKGLANALLRTRGELSEYSPEEVGHRLDVFALRRTRQQQGMFLLLDPDTSRLVHGLTLQYEIVWNMTSAPACKDCKLERSWKSICDVGCVGYVGYELEALEAIRED